MINYKELKSRLLGRERGANAEQKPDAPKQQPTAPPKAKTIRVGIKQPDGSIKVVEMPAHEAMKHLNPPGWY